jgi:hypothetical protein
VNQANVLMPLLSNGFANKCVSKARGYNKEEQCFLGGTCRDVISKKSYWTRVVGVESWCQLRLAVAEPRGHFGNPEEKERPPMEAVNRKPTENRQLCAKETNTSDYQSKPRP